MCEVHERLGAAPSLSRESLEDGAEVEPLTRETLLYCWGFCAALDGHHRAEEESLSPASSRRTPTSRR